jgi:TolB-like protein/Tfp pilus assembly protein PilF
MMTAGTGAPAHGRTAWSGALAVAVPLCVCAFVRPSFAQCPDGTPPPCARAARTAAAPAPTSVAVLYFDNLSRDTSDAYLADGLTEETIARLGQIDRLVVASRYAARHYRGGTAADPPTVGRALGVANLVTGSVQRAGHQLRVRVELVRAASGIRVWGEQYDRTDSDLLALEEDIAKAIATAVAGRLAPSERASLAARPTRSPAAYDHFLRGNYYLAQRRGQAVRRAIQEYEAAAHQDPTFSAAIGRAALGYGLFVTWGWEYPGVPEDSLLSRGFAAADRALWLDSTSSDTWMARAYLLARRYPRTYQGVRAVFERAIALDPKNAEAFHQYGSVLRLMGADSESAMMFQRALALEAERPITLALLAEVYAATRQFGAARVKLDSAIAVDPGFFYAYLMRSRVHAYLGNLAQARGDAVTALGLGRGVDSLWADASLGFVEAQAGDSAAARARIERLLQRSGAQGSLEPHTGWYLGAVLLAAGQRERALDLLEHVEPRGGRLWFYLRMPDFDGVRSEPRFQRLIEESRPTPAPQ